MTRPPSRSPDPPRIFTGPVEKYPPQETTRGHPVRYDFEIIGPGLLSNEQVAEIIAWCRAEFGSAPDPTRTRWSWSWRTIHVFTADDALAVKLRWC